MSSKRRSRKVSAPKKASRRAAPSNENEFYKLYNFLFSKPQDETEADIRSLQDAVRSETPSDVIGKMQEPTDALDQKLADLGCPISLTPEQRQVLITALLNPYFQKVRPWDASSSTW